MDTINSANFSGAGVHEVPPQSLWDVRLRIKNEDDICMPLNSNWVFICREEHQKRTRHVQKDRYFTKNRIKDFTEVVSIAFHEKMSACRRFLETI